MAEKLKLALERVAHESPVHGPILLAEIARLEQLVRDTSDKLKAALASASVAKAKW